MSREPEAAIDDPEDDKLERMEKEKFPGEAPGVRFIGISIWRGCRARRRK
jgi:hypothetical protein